MFFASTTYLVIHVAISLIAIGAGLAVLYGMLNNRRMGRLTAVFLGFTLATSLTGFLFPFHGVTPAIAVGIISCALLVPALAALYQFHLIGFWRPLYVVTALAALYLNGFVLVVQAFLKIPALHALAPLGNEPPFAIVQGLVLFGFIAAGRFSLKRYHPGGVLATLADVPRKAA